MKLFLLLINLIFTKNYAILINTSKQFFNYRHMANITAFKSILLKMNFNKNNIFLFAPENTIINERNPYKNKIYFNNIENIKRQNVKIINLTEKKVLDLLKLNLKIFKNIDENDFLLFYLCGHGRDGFLKINDRYFLFNNDLKKAIHIVSKRIKKGIFILDTCQAETLLFENIPENISIITTSLAQEYSYSSNIVRFLGVYGIDDFIYTIYKLVENSNVLKYKEKTISDILKIINNELSSTVTLSGNVDVKVSEIIEEDKKRELLKFKIN